MKKIMIFAVIAAMFSLASCQKDEFVANNEVKGSPVFTAVINSESTKTTVAIDGNKGKISWEQTDEITITDLSTPTPKTAVYKVKSIDETTKKATFEIKSGETALGAGPYTATYGVAQPTYQTYSASAPASAKLYMEAPSTATKEFVFDVKCGLMKLNLTKSGETITNISVTGTPTGGTETTYTLYCSAGEDISSGKDFYIALPAGSYNKIEVYKHDATNGFKVCSLNPNPSSPIAIDANHIKPVIVPETKISFSDCQYVPGVFSVSATKMVRFSQGNLTCDISGATQDWRFYEHQYDCATAYDANLISLFTWGYDATNSIDPDGTEYVSGHDTDGESFDSTEDWGTQIGGSNTWRTLTKDEWCYLFAYDPDNFNFIEDHPRRQLFNCGVTVCGKANCIVLLPDGWVWNEATVGTSLQSEYNETTTDVKWSTMEAAGAVCLPAAGYRIGSDVYEVGDSGGYWSSSAYDSDHAYYVTFGSDYVYPDYYDYRYIGYSVRLITESK